MSEANEIRVSVADFRRQMKTLLDGDRPIMIERGRRPIAVVLPLKISSSFGYRRARGMKATAARKALKEILAAYDSE